MSDELIAARSPEAAPALSARLARCYTGARTEEVVSTESEMRQALIGGMDPVAAYDKFGKF
jgi:hypothetical protein